MTTDISIIEDCGVDEALEIIDRLSKNIKKNNLHSQTAPSIGINKKVFVIGYYVNNVPISVVNPVVVNAYRETTFYPDIINDTIKFKPRYDSVCFKTSMNVSGDPIWIGNEIRSPQFMKEDNRMMLYVSFLFQKCFDEIHGYGPDDINPFWDRFRNDFSRNDVVRLSKNDQTITTKYKNIVKYYKEGYTLSL